MSTGIANFAFRREISCVTSITSRVFVHVFFFLLCQSSSRKEETSMPYPGGLHLVFFKCVLSFLILITIGNPCVLNLPVTRSEDLRPDA